MRIFVQQSASQKNSPKNRETITGLPCENGRRHRNKLNQWTDGLTDEDAHSATIALIGFHYHHFCANHSFSAKSLCGDKTITMTYHSCLQFFSFVSHDSFSRKDKGMTTLIWWAPSVKSSSSSMSSLKNFEKRKKRQKRQFNLFPLFSLTESCKTVKWPRPQPRSSCTSM